MLALPREVGLVYEPFNVQIGLREVPRQFLYVTEGSPEEELAARMVTDLLAGRARFRPSEIMAARTFRQKLSRQVLTSRSSVRYRLIAINPVRTRWLVKDPMAAFASEWMHRRFGFQAVVVVRHPAAAVASYRRLGWRFGLDTLTTQPDLMRDHLEPLLGGVDPAAVTPVEEGALLWTAYYTVLGRYLDRNPEMIVVRHEDISADPVAELAALYEPLGLDLTPRIRKAIERHTGTHNPAGPDPDRVHRLRRDSEADLGRWRTELAPADVATIKMITADVAARWYASDDWTSTSGDG
jgi:hypothetical protein